MQSMKVLSFILARSGSKGIPNKNIKELNGKPLIAYVLEEARKIFDIIYVSTDSPKYAFIVAPYGGTVLWRPEELAQDDSKSVDVINYHLKNLKGDAVLLINACCPFTLSTDMEECIKMMEENNADSVVSLVEDFSCHASKVVYLEDDNDNFRIFDNDKGGFNEFKTNERQKLEKCFKRNTALYLTKREVIESGTFFGPKTYGYIMPKSRSLDINDEIDFAYAETLQKLNTH